MELEQLKAINENLTKCISEYVEKLCFLQEKFDININEIDSYGQYGGLFKNGTVPLGTGLG
jgi:hypothetical protein